MVNRPDLRALTLDSLAALTNKGLVKRAQKDVERDAPTLVQSPDDTVTATFADGVVVGIPTGGLDAATCTCGATGKCRHIVGAVLAVWAAAEPVGLVVGEPVGSAVEEPVATAGRGADTESSTTTDDVPVQRRWSPGAFSDESLTERFGAPAMSAARRRRTAGYLARVSRPVDGGPIAIELPTCTVRFLVDGELGFVDTDARDSELGLSTAMAVWAARIADDVDAEGYLVDVEVGGRGASDGLDTALGAAIDLADEVLLDGVRQTAGGLSSTIGRVTGMLDAANLRWPAAAVDDLEQQLNAYRDGHAGYDRRQVAEIIAELHARHRQTTGAGETLRSRVLGTQESAETALGRVRLIGLGARVIAHRARAADVDAFGRAGSASATDELVVDVYLADVRSGTVLLARSTARGAIPDTATVARRRIGGFRAVDLSRGTVVTESAHRDASRLVRLGKSSVAKSTIDVTTQRWDQLPESVVVQNYSRLRTELADRPPRLIRPRVEAESVRVLPIASVGAIGYRPGAQELLAEIIDAEGTPGTVRAAYRDWAPGALDVLHDALTTTPTRLSGAVRLRAGRIVVEPLAVQTSGGVVLPDLTARDGGALTDHAAVPPEPLDAALDAIAEFLADTVHNGLRRPPPTHRDRCARVVAQARAVGLNRLADDLARLGADGGDRAALRSDWVDAQIRLSVTAEFR